MRAPAGKYKHVLAYASMCNLLCYMFVYARKCKPMLAHASKGEHEPSCARKRRHLPAGARTKKHIMFVNVRMCKHLQQLSQIPYTQIQTSRSMHFCQHVWHMPAYGCGYQHMLATVYADLMLTDACTCGKCKCLLAWACICQRMLFGTCWKRKHASICE